MTVLSCKGLGFKVREAQLLRDGAARQLAQALAAQ